MQVARFWRMKQQYYRMEAYKADVVRPKAQQTKEEPVVATPKTGVQPVIANVA